MIEYKTQKFSYVDIHLIDAWLNSFKTAGKQTHIEGYVEFLGQIIITVSVNG